MFSIAMSLEPTAISKYLLVPTKGQNEQIRKIASFQAGATFNPRTSGWKGNEK